MDKFFKRLFDKIAAFHQEQAHLSASIAETKLDRNPIGVLPL